MVGIVPGGDTGAYECAMWNLLGDRPVTALVFDAFGEGTPCQDPSEGRIYTQIYSIYK